MTRKELETVFNNEHNVDYLKDIYREYVLQNYLSENKAKIEKMYQEYVDSLTESSPVPTVDEEFMVEETPKDIMSFEEFIYSKIVPQIEIDENDLLNLLKKSITNYINKLFTNAISTITNMYPEHEQMTWDQQEQEARAYLNDPDNADVILIKNIAEVRGLKLRELAGKIVEKANAYKNLVSLAIGYRQKAEDMLESATDMSSFEAVVEELEKNKNKFYEIVNAQ